MPRFDVGAALDALHALSDFNSLNNADDLWTWYLKNPEPGAVPENQKEALTRLVGEMGERLGRAGRHAERLQRLVEQEHGSFDSAFMLVLNASPLQPNQRSQFAQIVEASGGFSGLALQQLGVVRAEAENEIQPLATKLERIRAGGITPGDVSRRVKCALIIALLTASIAGLLATGSTLAPAVLEAAQLGPDAILAAFQANSGLAFIIEATNAVVHAVQVSEDCFARKV
jgi:hypothetical protein